LPNKEAVENSARKAHWDDWSKVSEFNARRGFIVRQVVEGGGKPKKGRVSSHLMIIMEVRATNQGKNKHNKEEI